MDNFSYFESALPSSTPPLVVRIISEYCFLGPSGVGISVAVEIGFPRWAATDLRWKRE
jgi:hypothetical protein